jgi:hypothetical protein
MIAVGRRSVAARLGSSNAWPFVVVVAAPLLFFAPLLVGQHVMYWGTPLLQFFPWRQLAFDMLRAGQWPLWNPYLGNGAPLLANYQTAIFYPPNWLGMILPLDVAMAWLAALHLSWAGAGMAALARGLGLKPLGQAVAGLAFGMSQYLVARAGFVTINSAAAWLPWLVWAVERHFDDAEAHAPLARRARPAVLLAMMVAMLLLAGHAQMAWYSLLLAGLWSLWRIFGLCRRPMTLAMTCGLLLAAVVSGTLLAAAQLLPTAELLGHSQRAGGADYEFAATYSYSPWRLITLLAPDLLGNPARGEFFGYGNYWEDAAYIGVVPLLLALGTAGRSLVEVSRRRRRTSTTAPAAGLPYLLLAVASAGVVWALGRNTPVFPLLYEHVPTFNLFQAPARIMLWPVFALSLLAGMGADDWQALQARALYWTRLGTAGAAAMLLVGLATTWLVLPDTQLEQQLRVAALAIAVAGAGLCLAGLLALARPQLLTPGWALAVVVIVAGDLVYANRGLIPAGPGDLYRREPAAAQALADAVGTHRLYQFRPDEQEVKFNRLLSFRSFGAPDLGYETREAMMANTALLSGYKSANNYDPLLVDRYVGLLDVLETTRSPALLRMLDVAVVASAAPLDWPVVAEGGAGVTFYRVPGQSQHHWVVYAAQMVTTEAAARRALAEPAFDPATTVILEPAEPAPARQAALTPTSNGIIISASLDEPGWVVLAETYYPGWIVSVDGQPAPLLRANYAFQAVAVTAGEHTIVFDYRPRSFRLGLWISSGMLLAWLAATLWTGLGGRMRRDD